MVDNITILSVESLYEQYARFARSYELSDNPLTGMTKVVPRSATFYCVVARGNTDMAFGVMNKLASRKKLRRCDVMRDDINHALFETTQHMVVYYV